MIIEAVKEAVASGQSANESDCRVLAQTCIESLSARNLSTPTVWARTAAERRANAATSSQRRDIQ